MSIYTKYLQNETPKSELHSQCLKIPPTCFCIHLTQLHNEILYIQHISYALRPCGQTCCKNKQVFVGKNKNSAQAAKALKSDINKTLSICCILQYPNRSQHYSIYTFECCHNEKRLELESLIYEKHSHQPEF